MKGLSYAGAGSPRGSVLRDAYINDNPPAGTLRTIPLRGLRDDVPAPVDTGSTEGPQLPPAVAPTSGSIWSDLTGAFGSLFTTTVSAGTAAADTSIVGAITGSGSTSPTKSTALPSAVTKAATIFGMPAATVTVLGLGALAYYAMKK